jgi:hypothetical protein
LAPNCARSNGGAFHHPAVGFAAIECDEMLDPNAGATSTRTKPRNRAVDLTFADQRAHTAQHAPMATGFSPIAVTIDTRSATRLSIS